MSDGRIPRVDWGDALEQSCTFECDFCSQGTAEFSFPDAVFHPSAELAVNTVLFACRECARDVEGADFASVVNRALAHPQASPEDELQLITIARDWFGVEV